MTVAALLALGVPTAANAQQAAALDLFDLGAPSFTTFTTRDGLPDPVTVTTQTDRQGVTWVGTPHGLAWYDGRRWQALDDPALGGYIQQLFVDDHGTLWACGSAFGLARYDGTQWHVDGDADGLTTRDVRRLVETDGTDGRRLWAVSPDAGLFYRAQGRWHAATGNAQLPHAGFLVLAQTRGLSGHPRLWAGSVRDGLWYREGDGPWEHFGAPSFDAGHGLSYLLVTHAHGGEALWLSSYDTGLWRLDAHGLRHWSLASGELPTNIIYDMAETPIAGGDSAVWASSRDGLLRVYHDRVQVFDRRYGLPSDAVRGVRAWRSPGGTYVLWVATEDGLARAVMDGGAWKTVSLLGAHQTGVLGVLLDRDAQGNERLWVGSDGDGLGLYQQHRWHYYDKASGSLPGDDVNMIVRADDAQGRPAVWLGTDDGQLLRVDDGPLFHPVDTPWPKTSGQHVNDMLGRRIDGKPEQWFATDDSGTYRLRDGKWASFRPAGATGNWSVRKLLAQTTAGGGQWLWATSDQGLARFDGTQWTLFGREIGLPGTDLIGMQLIPDARGRPVLWLGSRRHGAIRVDIGDPLHPHALPQDLPPPPDLTTDGGLADASGRIYLCTDSGVQLLTPESGGFRSQVFTVRDGMVNNECNPDAQFIDAHDRYWTGTLGGLIVHDPALRRPDHDAKPLMLVDVRVDERPVHGRPVVVPPGQHELRVDFALLSWQRESESRFRTWLEGFGAEPGPWTEDNFRDIGALPHGRYVLHIEGRDYAGNLSRTILLPIVVMPHWWQRPAALALFAVLALAALYGLLRWRTLALRRRQHALERRIDARTEELNKANRQLQELARRDGLTGLFNRRWLMEALRPGPGGLRRQRSVQTALVFIDVDDFKTYNDRYGHLAGDHALRIVAETLLKFAPADAVVARYGGEEFACLLFDTSLGAAHAIAERMRAAVANRDAAAHGEAVRRITISAGVACQQLLPDDDAEDLLREADEALYAAKRAGRNCVRDAAHEL
nr:diguanylate cyclase [Rhodanobacter sp. DHB23]